MSVRLFGDWQGKHTGALERAFATKLDHFDGDDVVGWYSYANGYGDALGFIRRGNEWFEFDGGHGSRWGMEGQGELIPVSLAYVACQLSSGRLMEYPQNFRDAVRDMVAK